MEDLFKFLVDWAGKNDFGIVVPNNDDDKNIDFININLKTKMIYFDELDINDALTEVG